MSRNASPYGSRGRLRGIDQGVRRVAQTFGKALFSTYSTKAVGEMAAEADAEWLVGSVAAFARGRHADRFRASRRLSKHRTRDITREIAAGEFGLIAMGGMNAPR